ncbi:MAG: hypothetical protein Q8N99_08480 [Nanoarchaeota archaeon]|nr:hypothetical protein [Nanoarchaeota archaeon]
MIEKPLREIGNSAYGEGNCDPEDGYDICCYGRILGCGYGNECSCTPAPSDEEKKEDCYVAIPGISNAFAKPTIYIECKCFKDIKADTLEELKKNLVGCPKIVKTEFKRWTLQTFINIQLNSIWEDIDSIKPPPMTIEEWQKVKKIIKSYMQSSYGAGDSITIGGLGTGTIDVNQVVGKGEKCRKINNQITGEDAQLMNKLYDIIINQIPNPDNKKTPVENIFNSDTFKNRKNLKCD